MIAAANTTDSHIIAIAETKLNSIPPKAPGYTWITKNRQHQTGGGVALLIRDDIKNVASIVTDIEEHEQEICWVELKLKNRNLYVGVYYGKQEHSSREEIENQFSQLTTQVAKLKKKGEIILTGDFNAKLEIKRGETVQKMSPNGRALSDFTRNLDLEVISLKANRGLWTRVNRNNPLERSVIDYIIGTKEIAEAVEWIEIDEEGTIRIKGKKDSDHNTIALRTRLKIKEKPHKCSIWNVKNKEGWAKYNNEIKREYENNPPKSYDELEKMINKAMQRSIGKVTVTKGKVKKRENEATKRIRKEKKEAKKEFNIACKEKSSERKEKLDRYVQLQQQLKQEYAKLEAEQIENRIERIAKEGGVNSREFWRIRKQILKGSQIEYDVITEEGEKITDPEDSKEYVAKYFEQLYQAREGRKEYEKWTNLIKKVVSSLEIEQTKLPLEENFSMEELNSAIKALKKNKAAGPDKIPNEAIIEANEDTRRIYLDTMNRILKTQIIPDQWLKGNIIRLYKGKGKKGKCSNERGITLASNVGKLFERLVNNRTIKKITMTDAQAGGKKGTATADHSLVLKDLIKIGRDTKKQVYLVFLDVTKAYDKAWLDAIMFVLHKQGLKSRLWTIIKKLNEKLTATIYTKHGETRPIRIKDSIRQGGVLSVMQYALLIDEINKAIQKTGLGIKTNNNTDEESIACLLWMDDVVLVATEELEMQELLNITDRISKRYHIEFGRAKSQALKIGRSKNKPKLHLGDMPIDNTNKYKYLGEVINSKLNLDDHISQMKGKVEAAYQTVLAITEDRHFKHIKMKAVWKLVNTCILPIITYGSETWEMNKKETAQVNAILDSILKRILRVPPSTPREALYVETGLLDIKTIVDRKRIGQAIRLQRNRSKLVETMLTNETPGGWAEYTKEILAKYQIEPEVITGRKVSVNRKITNKVHILFKEYIEQSGITKSKVQHLLAGKIKWQVGTGAKYMYEMTRDNAETIFKARTRMLKVKNNYRGAFNDVTCRICNNDPETQQHILEECPGIHTSTENKVTPEDLFSEDIHQLEETCKKN